MNLEGVTTETIEVGSPLGFKMNMRVTVIPDGCSTCHGEGTVSYVLPEDQEAWDNREPCDCCHCQCCEMEAPANGTKACEACGGTGRIPGAGPLYTTRMTLPTQIYLNRRLMEGLVEIDRSIIQRCTFD